MKLFCQKKKKKNRNTHKNPTGLCWQALARWLQKMKVMARDSWLVNHICSDMLKIFHNLSGWPQDSFLAAALAITSSVSVSPLT